MTCAVVLYRADTVLCNGTDVGKSTEKRCIEKAHTTVSLDRIQD